MKVKELKEILKCVEDDYEVKIETPFMDTWYKNVTNHYSLTFNNENIFALSFQRVKEFK